MEQLGVAESRANGDAGVNKRDTPPREENLQCKHLLPERCRMNSSSVMQPHKNIGRGQCKSTSEKWHTKKIMSRHNDSGYALGDSLGKQSNTLEATTTTTQFSFSVLLWGCIQLVLSLRPLASGLRSRGGARDTSRNVQLLEGKRYVHVCPTKGAYMYVSWVKKSSALQMYLGSGIICHSSQKLQ